VSAPQSRTAHTQIFASVLDWVCQSGVVGAMRVTSRSWVGWPRSGQIAVLSIIVAEIFARIRNNALRFWASRALLASVLDHMRRQ